MGWLLLISFIWFIGDRLYSDSLMRGTFKYHSYEFLSDLVYFGIWIAVGIITSFDAFVYIFLILFLIMTVYHLTIAIQKCPKRKA